MRLIEEIKEEEKLAIDELRKRVKSEIEQDLYDDTYFFHRFLSARDFNIDNAEDMLRKHIEWRKKNDVKNIFNFKEPEVVEKYLVYEIIGFGKDGCPIRYCPVGNIDFIGLTASLKFDEIEKVIIHKLEADTKILKEQSEKLKKNVDKSIYIVDLKNLSFAQVTDKRSITVLIFLLNLYIYNYPERLKAAYAINAFLSKFSEAPWKLDRSPIYFNVVYSLLRTLLPSKVMDKIYIYSDESYKKDILKHVDADELPEFLGGNQKNSSCLTKIKQAGQSVPEKYFIHRSKRTLSKLPGVQKVTLARAAFHEVNMDVKEPGSYLEWEFETKCRDIGFGLFLNEMVDGEEKITELVPIQRIDTEEYPETGTIKCEHPGTYVIVFDNTYSWIRAKEIYYRAKIVSPEEHDAEIKQK